jgi:hypothetical protein
MAIETETVRRAEWAALEERVARLESQLDVLGRQANGQRGAIDDGSWDERGPEGVLGTMGGDLWEEFREELRQSRASIE